MRYVLLLFWFSTCLAKTIIITSASGELGGATARVLAAEYDLILTGRDLSKLNQLQKELTAAHPTHQYKICPLDFTSQSSRDKFKDFLNQPISGLVLIGPRPQFGKGVLQEEKQWLETIQSTFTGPIEVLKSALPYFTNPAHIVVIAGTTSVQLQPEYGPACVIRRMWTTYTKALSHQLGPQGIRVNALSPGVVLTSFHEERIQIMAVKNGVSNEEQMRKEVAAIPLGRHAEPEEVAQTIKFLLQSNFINGVNLVLDGGFTLNY